MYMLVHRNEVHMMKYDSAAIKNEILSFTSKWKQLGYTVLSEKNLDRNVNITCCFNVLELDFENKSMVSNNNNKKKCMWVKVLPETLFSQTLFQVLVK